MDQNSVKIVTITKVSKKDVTTNEVLANLDNGFTE
jgi:hypothetical protein